MAILLNWRNSASGQLPKPWVSWGHQAEFPEAWPAAFQDCIALLADGAGAADMFCRILTSVDEDVISLEIPRWAACPLA